MDVAEYQRCEIAHHVGRLRAEGALLAEAADRAGLDAPVPSCPPWRVRDLLKHLGAVHRWAAGYVGEARATWVDRASEEEILRSGPGDEALPNWFREGHAQLVRTLEAADPDMTCWTFLEAPSPLAFWARRQAHETAIHRVDAEQAAAAAVGPAAGPAGLFDPWFAADGVDEMLMGFLGREMRRGSWRGPLGAVGFHAADENMTAHWRAVAAPGAFAVERAAGPADCDVTGRAVDLYLLLWHRGPLDAIAVEGDAGLLAGLREQTEVTWR